MGEKKLKIVNFKFQINLLKKISKKENKLN